MLEDSQPAVLLTQAHLVSELPLEGVAQVVCIDTDADKVGRLIRR